MGSSNADRGGFRKLWLATTVSQLGTQVSELALPFIAIATLRVTPFEIGLLNAVQFLPILALSLAAGVWVDRLRRRPILIACDLGRALILLSIPAAYELRVLSLLQLYVVAFLVGSLTVFFDVADQSYLPALVAADGLIAANSRLQVSEQGASVIGPALGGFLISLITAPIAVAADTLSYLASAGFILGIRRPEPKPVPKPDDAEGGWIREAGEGLAFVAHDPVLRATAMTAGLLQFFGRMVFAVLLVYLVRQVGLSAAAVGTILSIGSIGFVVGALAAGRLSSTLGFGRTIIGAALLASVAPVFYAIAPPQLAGLFVAAGFFLYGVAALAWTINSVSLRQAITPPRLLGRMNASMRLISWGAIPIGSLVGGFLGGAIGLRQTMLLAAVGSLTASLPVLLSPIRGWRGLTQPTATIR